MPGPRPWRGLCRICIFISSGSVTKCLGIFFLESNPPGPLINWIKKNSEKFGDFLEILKVTMRRLTLRGVGLRADYNKTILACLSGAHAGGLDSWGGGNVLKNLVTLSLYTIELVKGTKAQCAVSLTANCNPPKITHLTVHNITCFIHFMSRSAPLCTLQF